MKITRFGKAVAYLAATAVLFVISALLMRDIHNMENMVDAYLRSDFYLFILSAAFLGTALYSYMAYTRRHKEHRGDSLFLLILGVITMVTTIILVIQYGGLNADRLDSALSAVNINLALLAVIPAVFLVRAFVLIFTSEKGKPGLLIAGGVLLVAMIAVMAAGGLLNMVREDDLPEETDEPVYGELWNPAQEEV